MNRLAFEFETPRDRVVPRAGAKFASAFIAASRSYASLPRPARLGILIILALLINAMAPASDQSNRKSASLLPLEPTSTSANIPPPQNGSNGPGSKIAFILSLVLQATSEGVIDPGSGAGYNPSLRRPFSSSAFGFKFRVQALACLSTSQSLLPQAKA
jgi:hypothetical protein